MRKELIVLQQDLKDCGICSLLSIIKYYRGNIPLEKLRIDTSTSKEGTNAYELLKAARMYGFDATGKKLNKLEELNDITLPCIAHIETDKFSHFVVIYKILDKKLVIMDPAKGKVKITFSDFAKEWTKIILEFYPSGEITNIKTHNYLKNFIKNIFKDNIKILLCLCTSKIILILISIILSFHFKINTLNYQKHLLLISLLFFIFYLFKIYFTYFENQQKIKLNFSIDEKLYPAFLNHLFLLPDNFVKNRTTGEIMSRVDELASLKEFFTEILLMDVLESIFVIIVCLVLIILNPMLFLVLCLFLLGYFIIGIFYSKILFQKIIQNIDVSTAYKSKIIENLDVYITLKNLGVIALAQTELNKKTTEFLNHNYALEKILIKFQTITDFFEQMLNYAIIVLGFVLIYINRLTIVDLYTYFFLMNYPISYIRNLIILIPKYNYIKASMHKISDYFDIPIEKEEKTNQYKSGDIIIKNLNYEISPMMPIFTNLNLKIKENTHVYLKGSSGVGKSTLCSLLAGLRNNNDLPIYINNQKISDIAKYSLRKNITYVGQRENLIQDTLKNNILFYRKVDSEYLNRILKICYIEEIASKKILGYETFIFKDSLNLSGGEKQRIILARALLNDFSVLILDEALSEVNDDLEINIIKNLRQLLKNKTIIYVSHKNHEALFDTVIDLNKQRRKEVQNAFK